MTRRELLFGLGAAAPVLAQWPARFDRLTGFIQRLLEEQKIAALSVALLDARGTIWAEGFGLADPGQFQPATADTIYRLGSISKLVTDLAAMQLVEQGRLQLDRPVVHYDQEFPYPEVTLRMLMCHRSGVAREPRAGSYFDPTGPGLRATVQSLTGVPLVYPAGSTTKYSNAGVSAVGRVVEVVGGAPFADYVQRQVLDPLGMTRSSFVPSPVVKEGLAKGFLWSYTGWVWEAPVFDFGIAPAGGLYGPVTDLARLLRTLADGGGPVVKPETLAQMMQPQLQGTRYGLGFGLGTLDGRYRAVGHDGAVYGFASTLLFLPEQKLGVAVAASKDGANGVTREVAREGLRVLLGTSKGEAGRVFPVAVASRVAQDIAARYENVAGAAAIDLQVRDREVYLTEWPEGKRLRVRAIGPEFMSDSPLLYGERLRAAPNGAVNWKGKLWKRMPVRKPAQIRAEWRPFIGEYGRDASIFYVLEREGHLSMLVDWFEFVGLEEQRSDPRRFRFPKDSTYAGEEVAFTSNGVTISGRMVTKRDVGGQGSVFRIQPRRPVAELRAEAERMSPPKEAGGFRPQELVDLATLDPGIKLDIRYAGTDNFLSAPSYTSARAFLQKPAAEATLRAHLALRSQGFGLLIHDAYRPWYITKVFWEATPPDKHEFVADPAKGSRHNRGCAVDLSMYHLASGEPVEMVGVYDEMSPRSYPEYPGGTSLQRWHREVLRTAMEREGFTVETTEWWHFNYRDWAYYRIGNESFEELTHR